MNGDTPSGQLDLREVMRAKHDAIIAIWKTVTKLVLAIGALIVAYLSVMTYRISVQAVESREEISSDLDTLKLMMRESVGDALASNRTNYNRGWSSNMAVNTYSTTTNIEAIAKRMEKKLNE